MPTVTLGSMKNDMSGLLAVDGDGVGGRGRSGRGAVVLLAQTRILDDVVTAVTATAITATGISMMAMRSSSTSYPRGLRVDCTSSAPAVPTNST